MFWPSLSIVTQDYIRIAELCGILDFALWDWVSLGVSNSLGFRQIALIEKKNFYILFVLLFRYRCVYFVQGIYSGFLPNFNDACFKIV